jgi:hypothetical protein
VDFFLSRLVTGLGLDQFRKFDPRVDSLELKLDEDSIFYKLGSSGLISFSDYVFLLTVLSSEELRLTSVWILFLKPFIVLLTFV